MSHYSLYYRIVILLRMHLILCYSDPSPRPLPVGATSRSRSYRKQALTPTEDRKGKRELSDVKRKNVFVLVKIRLFMNMVVYAKGVRYTVYGSRGTVFLSFYPLYRIP
jgi:hypothetical protein